MIIRIGDADFEISEPPPWVWAYLDSLGSDHQKETIPIRFMEDGDE